MGATQTQRGANGKQLMLEGEAQVGFKAYVWQMEG
jgi:hypothetical protein